MLRSKTILHTCLILSTIFLNGCTQTESPTLNNLSINNIEYQVKVVSKPEDLQQGLMFTKDLPENQGMLFEFPETQIRTFWMKNTLIPLDIIFIDQNKQIINIAANTPPCQEIDPQQINCPTYSSTKPAKFVLELNANQAQKHNFEPDTLVSF